MCLVYATIQNIKFISSDSFVTRSGSKKAVPIIHLEIRLSFLRMECVYKCIAVVSDKAQAVGSPSDWSALMNIYLVLKDIITRENSFRYVCLLLVMHMYPPGLIFAVLRDVIVVM